LRKLFGEKMSSEWKDWTRSDILYELVAPLVVVLLIVSVS